MVNKNTAIRFFKKPDTYNVDLFSLNRSINCVHAYFHTHFFTNWVTCLISVKWKLSFFTRDISYGSQFLQDFREFNLRQIESQMVTFKFPQCAKQEHNF